LRFAFLLTPSAIKSMKEEVPELGTNAQNKLKISAPNAIINSGKMSLADMITQGGKIFELDNAVTRRVARDIH